VSFLFNNILQIEKTSNKNPKPFHLTKLSLKTNYYYL